VDVRFGHDGARLATASSRGVTFWDATSGALLGQMRKTGPAHGLSFSSDGQLLAFARGFKGGAEVRDTATDTSLATVDGLPYTADWSVALSPDGRTLAVGGWGTAVRVVDVGTGKLVHELDLAGTGAYALEFSPDGRILAVSGFENVASLWDVATGAQIGPRLTAGSRRTLLDLSPDGRRLLVTTGNGEGAVWDIEPESWERRACVLANRTLTREEWEEFLPGRPYEPACTT
jgi:WD40 repeat protein